MKKVFAILLFSAIFISAFGASISYTVESGNPAANYETLKDALISVPNYDSDIITLILLENQIITSNISISGFHDLTIKSLNPDSKISCSPGTGASCRIFEITSTATVTLENLNISGGKTSSNGGGIYNEGELTIENCLITGNSSENRTVGDINKGGGIYNKGTLTVVDSDICDNTVKTALTGGYNYDDCNPDYGGGIYNEVGATATITGGTIESNIADDDYENSSDLSSKPDYNINKGGGIYNDGTMTITDCQIFENEVRSVEKTFPVVNGEQGDPIYKTHAEGGSIYNNSILNIENCTIRDHLIAGNGIGIFNSGQLSINSTQFTNNGSSLLLVQGYPGGMRGSGGAIYNSGTIINLDNSSFTGSSFKCSYGQGIYNTAQITVSLCQFSDLHSSVDGGAIFNIGSGSSTISESSFLNNSAEVFGGAIYNVEQATLTLNICTIAKNNAGGRDTNDEDDEDYYKTGCGIANGDSYPQGIFLGKTTANESILNIINCTIADNHPLTPTDGYKYFGNGLLLGNNSITSLQRTIITDNLPNSNIYPGNGDIDGDVEVTIHDNGLNVVEISDDNKLAKSTDEDDESIWTDETTHKGSTSGINLSLDAAVNSSGIPVLPLQGGSFVFEMTSTGFIGSHDYVNESSLPVELVSFKLSLSSRGILLKWVTESEINNAGFILERRKIDFAWEVIADFKTNDDLIGAGNSSTKNSYQFLDSRVATGETYEYRLIDVYLNGEMKVHNDKIRKITISNNFGTVPDTYQLAQLYPNPFNPVTTISYTIPDAVNVKLTIYNLQGKPVKTLVNSIQNAGHYSVIWNASEVGSGIYFYKLEGT